MDNKSIDDVLQRLNYGISNIPDSQSISEKDCEYIEALINKKIKQMRKKNHDPLVCEQYLHSFIDEQILNKMNEVEISKQLNIKQTERIFVRRKADISEIQALIDTINEEIEETDAELKAVKLLYDKFDPLRKSKDTDEKKGDDEDE